MLFQFFPGLKMSLPILSASTPPPPCSQCASSGLKHSGLPLPPFTPSRELWGDWPHPATFGQSHLLLSASPPTPFNLRIIADREGGAGGCLASIMVTWTSLRDSHGLLCLPHNLQKNGMDLSVFQRSWSSRQKKDQNRRAAHALSRCYMDA